MIATLASAVFAAVLLAFAIATSAAAVLLDAINRRRGR
jgi:hypothetical protein